jgi:hypothetical protein
MDVSRRPQFFTHYIRHLYVFTTWKLLRERLKLLGLVGGLETSFM